LRYYSNIIFKVGKEEYTISDPDTPEEYKDYHCHSIKIHDCKTCQGIPVPPDTSGSFKGCRYCCSVGEEKVCQFHNLILNYIAYFGLVVIDRLLKSQAGQPVKKALKEIPHPAKITNLQRDMGPANDKKLYSQC
jgi:hypothetical protein